MASVQMKLEGKGSAKRQAEGLKGKWRWLGDPSEAPLSTGGRGSSITAESHSPGSLSQTNLPGTHLQSLSRSSLFSRWIPLHLT